MMPAASTTLITKSTHAIADAKPMSLYWKAVL